MPKPYTKESSTDEGRTERVPQTHNTSWHLPDDNMSSQEAVLYQPEYNISLRSQVSILIFNITVCTS